MAAKEHEHDGTRPSCWGCLTVEERVESQRIWLDICAEPRLGLRDQPDFRFDLAHAITEVVSGKGIEMKRPEQGGKRIIFPQSLFWTFVDLIHEERKQIQE